MECSGWRIFIPDAWDFRGLRAAYGDRWTVLIGSGKCVFCEP
jgi:hypothetical protein